jgi:hypothetical protein
VDILESVVHNNKFVEEDTGLDGGHLWKKFVKDAPYVTRYIEANRLSMVNGSHLKRMGQWTGFILFYADLFVAVKVTAG